MTGRVGQEAEVGWGGRWGNSRALTFGRPHFTVRAHFSSFDTLVSGEESEAGGLGSWGVATWGARRAGGARAEWQREVWPCAAGVGAGSCRCGAGRGGGRGEAGSAGTRRPWQGAEREELPPPLGVACSPRFPSARLAWQPPRRRAPRPARGGPPTQSVGSRLTLCPGDRSPPSRR